jgi:hypothetical protein
MTSTITVEFNEAHLYGESIDSGESSGGWESEHRADLDGEEVIEKLVVETPDGRSAGESGSGLSPEKPLYLSREPDDGNYKPIIVILTVPYDLFPGETITRIIWQVDGERAGTGPTLEINSEVYPFNDDDQYQLTLIIEKDGVPFSLNMYILIYGEPMI